MKTISKLSIVTFMPIFSGKRLEFVGVKFSEEEKNQFEKIGIDEDRAMSYVVRELALRGLVLYLQDRNLKATPEEIELAKRLLGESGEHNHTSESSKMVIRTVPHVGKIGGGENLAGANKTKKKVG